MDFWIFLWKAVFLATISVYAIMALWVTVQGARDIKSMLGDLRRRHDEQA